MTEEEFKKNAKTIPINIEKEEKAAIDYFKYKVLPTTSSIGFESKGEHYAKVLLNLIEKLQKENEELNNRDTSRLSEIGRLRTKNSHLENEIKYYYIPKDEIEKIKNKNIGQYMNFYREIEELLEEEKL